jgi:hypothetical protein
VKAIALHDPNMNKLIVIGFNIEADAFEERAMLCSSPKLA